MEHNEPFLINGLEFLDLMSWISSQAIFSMMNWELYSNPL